MILQVIAILIVVLAVYLLIVALVPGLSVPSQELNRVRRPDEAVEAKPPPSRRDVSFAVKGTSISAWLYLPSALSAPVPCIVMGHGGGGTKDMGMETYAVRFQEAGFAVLAFDYRHFGKSGGEPRQLMWIPYQLEDYAASVEYARSLKEIDSAKIALWGTSASGGHVIVIAAGDHRIACAVAQCPGLDGRASASMAFKRDGFANLPLLVHGQRDLVRSWLGLSPHKIPIVGKPGTRALMTTQDAYDGYSKLVRLDFVNEACARIAIRGDKYRPVKKAKNVRCPVLLQICEHDSFTPLSAAEEAERCLGEYAEVKLYPIGHFDIYSGEDFERSLSDQLEFFKKHLG